MPLNPSATEQAREMFDDIADMMDIEDSPSEEVIKYIARWLQDCYDAGYEDAR
jgi:hypothetical protein